MSNGTIPVVSSYLNRNLYLVKEHVGLLKAANNYDVLLPETGEPVLFCREESLSFWTKVLRLSNHRTLSKFDIRVLTPDGRPVLRVRRGVPIVVSTVDVLDPDGLILGSFRQKPFSISGAFDVLDAAGQMVCRIKGGLTGWTYRFMSPADVELGRVTKKWAGLSQELFSPADDYLLQIDDAVPADSMTRLLILASVVCIGMVLKVELP
jgi:uncharacterized protein YxjI